MEFQRAAYLCWLEARPYPHFFGHSRAALDEWLREISGDPKAGLIFRGDPRRGTLRVTLLLYGKEEAPLLWMVEAARHGTRQGGYSETGAGIAQAIKACTQCANVDLAQRAEVNNPLGLPARARRPAPPAAVPSAGIVPTTGEVAEARRLGLTGVLGWERWIVEARAVAPEVGEGMASEDIVEVLVALHKAAVPRAVWAHACAQIASLRQPGDTVAEIISLFGKDFSGE